MLYNKKIFLVISLIYIIYTVVPIIQDVSGVEIWIVNLTTFLILFVLYPRAFANPVIYWFLVYAIILTFYFLLNKPLAIGIGTVRDSKKIIIEFAYFLPSLSIFSILYYCNDDRLYKIISATAIICILISFFYLLPLIMLNKNILRMSIYVKNHIGLPSYSLMHAYVIILPAIIYGIKVINNWKKGFIFLTFFIFIFIILNTHITTSLIIMFAIIIFSLFGDFHHKIRSLLTMSMLFSISYILHISGVFIEIFDFFIEYFKDTAVQSKMKDFKILYLTGEIEGSSNLAGRSNLHKISWSAFYDNIFFGSSPVGNHSSFIDRLGGMGLLAFIPFSMIIISHIKLCLKVIRTEEAKKYYSLGVFAVCILLYQKGLFGQEGWLFMMILLPSFIISLKMLSENS